MLEAITTEIATLSKSVFRGLPVRGARDRREVVEEICTVEMAQTNRSGRQEQWARVPNPGPETELCNTYLLFLSYLTSRSFILSSTIPPMLTSQGPYAVKI